MTPTTVEPPEWRACRERTDEEHAALFGFDAGTGFLALLDTLVMTVPGDAGGPFGGLLFPDGPEDAATMHVEHGAVPLHPERWPWPGVAEGEPI